MADGSRSRPGPDQPPPAESGQGGSATAEAGGSDTTRGGERGERAIAAVGALFRRFGRWMVRFTGESLRAWRYLDFEQRVAGIGALLLIVSTFGPFSFVEAAIVLVGLAVLLLLKKRADGRSFHLPFGDGAVIMAAGAWSALLIVIRLFDRPLGQNLLALVCAAILTLAGLRMRLRRPMDDLPEERLAEREAAEPEPEVEIEFAGRGDTAETEALPRDGERTERLPERTPAERRPADSPPPRRPAEPPPEGAPARLRRQTPAARRSPPPPAVSPPTAVRPPELPPPPTEPERSDPDFDLPTPEERPPVGPPAPRQARQEPPPAAPEADEGPFRTRPADDPPRPRTGG